jgi:hypothetical protein
VLAPSLDKIVKRPQYHRYEAPHVPERKDGRERTALYAPWSALHGEQAVAQCGEHPLLEAVLGIVVTVISEHPANGYWVIDNGDFAKGKPGHHDCMFKM